MKMEKRIMKYLDAEGIDIVSFDQKKENYLL